MADPHSIDFMTMGGHGIIIVLLGFVLKHIRSIKITMKNGNGEGE